MNSVPQYLDEDIYEAISSGNTEHVSSLVRTGIDVNHVFTATKDSKLHGYSLLHIAVMENRQNVIKYLISKGCDVNIAMRVTSYDADSKRSNVEKVKPPSSLEHTCLYRCLIFGQLESAEQLVRSGADVNLFDVGGSTALWHAVDSNNTEMTKLILSVPECDVNAVDSVVQMAPLHVAAIHGNLENIKCLIRKSAIIDAPQLGGSTPLKHVCKSGNIEGVKMLLQHGADVNKRDCDHTSPLLAAISSTENSQTIIELLAVNGATVQSVDVKNSLQSLGIQGPVKLLKHPNLIPYLLSICDQPLSLKLLASLKIKFVLRLNSHGKSIKRKITRLPLPTVLLKFLILVDL